MICRGWIFSAIFVAQCLDVAQTASAVAQAAAPDFAALTSALGSENYLEAKRLSDAILQRGSPEDRQKTMAVYGRILLGLGQKDEARQYLAMLSKQGGGTQLAVYDAWCKALEKKPDEAIKALEKMLEQSGGSPDETIAEAADVLAMLYMARGEQEKAKKSVDFGLKVLNYRGVKDGYVLSLLSGRLKSDFTAGEAKRLYNEAEKLREKGKLAEAGQLFAQVRAMYPKNQWGHASGFRIGQCFVGLKQTAKAADWWQKFLKESPAGPWRGQTRVALVDMALEQLDLKKATEQTLAAGAALTKGLDKDAEPSWKEAAYDIYLRQGIVSLADGRFDPAVQGFQQAKQAFASGSGARGEGVSAGLDRLIEAAQHRTKLIPEELTVGDDRAAKALTLGNISIILHQYDLAKGYFGLPLSGVMRSKSAGHRSFAGLGLARAVIDSGKAIKSSSPRSQAGEGQGVREAPVQARAICEASLAEYPKGSWHDETLYRLAAMIQDQAEKQGQPAKPSGSQDCDAKAEKERHAVLVKAKAEALPHWQDLINRYPQSPHCEEALYNAGVLLYEMAEVTPREKSQQLFKDADSLFDRLCETYRKSPYAGDAFVRRIDFALERLFDLKMAQNLSANAVDWAKGSGEQPCNVGTDTTGFWCMPASQAPYVSLITVTYKCYQRAGLIAYLSQEKDHAVALFQEADKLDDSPQKRVGGETAMERMIAVVQGTRSPLTPQKLMDALKDDRQRTCLAMADLSLLTFDPVRAGGLYERLLAGDRPFAKPTVDVESYLLLRMGQSLEFQRKHDEAMDCLKRLYNPKYAKFPWTADGIFRVGTWSNNATQDPSTAMKHWEHVFTKYPDHPEAERSLFYYALSAMETKDYRKATAAFTEYLHRYPNSRWTNRVEKELLPEAKKWVKENEE